MASPSNAPAASSPAPQAAQGGVNPGDPGARPTAAPVKIDAAATPAPGVQAKLLRIEAVAGLANLPGEVGGPSLRVTVQVDNGISGTLDLRYAVVNLYYGPEKTPAITLTEPGAKAFPDSIGKGGHATSAWVFNVPVDARDQVVVELDLSSAATVVLFEGAAHSV